MFIGVTAPSRVEVLNLGCAAANVAALAKEPEGAVASTG
jgi:hypothetical protein